MLGIEPSSTTGDRTAAARDSVPDLLEVFATDLNENTGLDEMTTMREQAKVVAMRA